MRRRLKVEPIQGEPLRFFVESQREAQGVPPYLVDLESLEGHGYCPCEHFQRRLLPLVLAQNKLPFDKRTPIYCLHLIDATEMFTRQMKLILIELNKGKKQVFGAKQNAND